MFSIWYGLWRFKNSNRRRFADKVLCGKAFNFAKNPKYFAYQRGLPSMIYIFFDKKASGSDIKNENISNKKLPEELYKPTIKKFEKWKVHSPFIDNIWDADLADMQLIRTFNERFRNFLCVIDIYSKWVIGLFLYKVKNILQFLMLFRKF